MMFAVVHGDAHVVQREAGDSAALQRLLDPLADRGQVLIRYRAALHRVDELEATAARERLDAQVDLAELPGSAGLLLVPVMALCGRGDRFAIGDAGRARLD